MSSPASTRDDRYSAEHFQHRGWVVIDRRTGHTVYDCGRGRIAEAEASALAYDLNTTPTAA